VGTIGGSRAGKKKRDRFSYNELVPVGNSWRTLHPGMHKSGEMSSRSPRWKSEILVLGGKVNDYELLVSSLGAAQPFRLINGDMLPETMSELAKTMQISGLLGVTPKLPITAIEAMMSQDASTMSPD